MDGDEESDATDCQDVKALDAYVPAGRFAASGGFRNSAGSQSKLAASDQVVCGRHNGQMGQIAKVGSWL